MPRPGSSVVARPGRGHEPRLDATLGTDVVQGGPLVAPGHERVGDGQRGQHVPPRAAAR